MAFAAGEEFAAKNRDLKAGFSVYEEHNHELGKEKNLKAFYMLKPQSVQPVAVRFPEFNSSFHDEIKKAMIPALDGTINVDTMLSGLQKLGQHELDKYNAEKKQ